MMVSAFLFKPSEFVFTRELYTEQLSLSAE